MPTQNIIRVVLWMSGTLLSFSLMAVSIRLLSNKLSVFEILAVRSIGAILILGSLLLARPSLRANLRTQRMPMHLLRSALHFAGQYCWALALTLLPFATCLLYTSPSPRD